MVTGNLAQDPYALPPARQDAWRDPIVAGGSFREPLDGARRSISAAPGTYNERQIDEELPSTESPARLPAHIVAQRPERRAMRPTSRSAVGPTEENPFRTGVDPAALESAASVLHAMWIRHLHDNMVVMWGGLAPPATTWLPSALEELEEIDREVLEDGLPGIKAETRREAARILRQLEGQAISPTSYPTDDGEIVIHFESRAAPAAVLIELSNDGQAACFSCVGGKNRRARYDDSSDLPDAFVMAQLKALAAEAAA